MSKKKFNRIFIIEGYTVKNYKFLGLSKTGNSNTYEKNDSLCHIHITSENAFFSEIVALNVLEERLVEALNNTRERIINKRRKYLGKENMDLFLESIKTIKDEELDKEIANITPNDLLIDGLDNIHNIRLV